MSNDFFDLEFAENADPRCAISIVLDTSSSMAQPDANGKVPLDELNEALDVLVSELNKDPLAKRRAEISFVTYGTEVSEPTPFSTVQDIVLPTLVPSGVTSTGKAIEAALDSIQERKKSYKENGIDYYKSWVLLITDGLPTDDIKAAKKKVAELEKKKSIAFFPVGVEGADMGKLQELSVRAPLKLEGTKFSELFVWLSASAAAVSASQPEDSGVSIPAPTGWATV